MGISGVVLVLVLSEGGCTKDTDCKGDRVCEAGVCVNPPAASSATGPESPPTPPPPPPTPPAEPGPARRPLGASPAEPTEPSSLERRPLPSPATTAATPDSDYPRVVRRGEQTCVQTLDAQGQVVESCRSAEPPGPRRDRRGRRQATEEPAEVRGGFAFDLNFRGSTLLFAAGSTTGALPAVSSTLGFGGVSAGGVGAMGLLTLDVGFGGGGTVVNALLAPALRLGRLSHVTLAGGLSVLTASTGRGSLTGLAFATQVQGVIQLAGAFSLALNGALTFDASGVMVTLGAGLGFSTPSP